jgi:transposase
VVKRTEAKCGFALLPGIRLVARGFAWAARFRRLARDNDRLASALAPVQYLLFACLVIANPFR